ncbi:uncharacterized protein LOC114792606 isoform X2 [Denticeps clupeoides]|uniref:uncharacterized protein LOC114792606 isoform X2 n=1 Tax=Denticeps clupeoides TaxID=299321 RepID=UPI0010A59C50|nr:uncharacterized protein LOC114792606 isoform X2 [Denticeps clupeoides]
MDANSGPELQHSPEIKTQQDSLRLFPAMSDRTSPFDIFEDAIQSTVEERAGDGIADDASSSYCTAVCSLSDCDETWDDGGSPPCSDSVTVQRSSPTSSPFRCKEHFNEEKNSKDETAPALSSEHVVTSSSTPRPIQQAQKEPVSAFFWAESRSEHVVPPPDHAVPATANLTPEAPISAAEKTPLSESHSDPVLVPGVRTRIIAPDIPSPYVSLSCNYSLTRLPPRATKTDQIFKFNTTITGGQNDEESMPVPRDAIRRGLIAKVQDRETKPGGSKPTEVPSDKGQALREGASGSRVYTAQPGKGDRGGEWAVQATEASRRAKQAELSLTARNRKVSASWISTLTANKSESGIPPRCYSECFLATRQQHRPHSPPKSPRWQKQSGQVAWRSGPLPQKLGTDCSGGSGSMGTKLDAAGGDAQGLGALALDTNYLDVYSSVESGFSDPSGKAARTLSPSNHNTSACSEASSSECIDVALETQDEARRGTKMVPKRQIQLKRREASEALASENNNKPLQAPRAPGRPRDIFLRQHSTPAAFHQESHGAEQVERRQRLQKSLSLDETSSKTKMASCLLKNVLSKKMQHEESMEHASSATLKDISADHFFHASAKEVLPESTAKALPSSSPSSQKTASPLSSLVKPEPVKQGRTIREHTGVSSRTCPRPPAKHGFNPLGLGRAEFQGEGTEITPSAETKNAEGSGEKLSCDSAKARTWDTSVCQAQPKSTPEEHQVGHGVHEQPTAEDRKDTAKVMSGEDDKAASPPGKERETDRADLKVPCPSGMVSLPGKFKGIAPVHVVRDVRSLVKNTYNLSFRGPGQEHSQHVTPCQSCTRAGDKGHRPVNKQSVKKTHVSPPVLTNKTRDISSQHSDPRGSRVKSKGLLGLHDESPNPGFTKVSPNNLSITNSCPKSKTQDGMDELSRPVPSSSQDKDRLDLTSDLPPDAGTANSSLERKRETAAVPYCVPAATQFYPPRSQATPTCVLTTATVPAAQMLPPYFYQAISPHIGTVGYVQGPVLLQTPSHAQPASPEGHAPLLRRLSEDGSLAAQSCYLDGHQGQQASPKHAGGCRGDEDELKTPSSLGQQYLCTTQGYVPTLSISTRRGSAGMLYPEFGGGAVPGQVAPRQLLLDPETGRCFLVDLPMQPQRKMLFDPQTCQYVEVLLPQQPRAVPLPLPAIYTPQCLPYLLSHTHPGP